MEPPDDHGLCVAPRAAGPVERDAGLRPVHEPNHFGVLRLGLAVLVILAHAPELLDGNRSREILTRMFGTMSFGDLAVDGFFLISGFLITKSFLRSRSSGSYLLKRVLRIYPAYIVAYLLCIFIVAPLGGEHLDGNAQYDGLRILLHVVLLWIPPTTDAFQGLSCPSVNGSMWTIAYEFRCYLLVLVLGRYGLLGRPKALVALAIGLLGLNAFELDPHISNFTPFIGTWNSDVRFFGLFLCGALFYIGRDRITYRADWAAISLAGLICLMFVPRLAEPAFALLGGYCLFWFAFRARAGILSWFDHRADISYGTYLYAWPIQTLLIWQFRDMSPWLLFGLSACISMAMGLLSWHLIERPCLALKPGNRLIRHEDAAAIHRSQQEATA